MIWIFFILLIVSVWTKKDLRLLFNIIHKAKEQLKRKDRFGKCLLYTPTFQLCHSNLIGRHSPQKFSLTQLRLFSEVIFFVLTRLWRILFTKLVFRQIAKYIFPLFFRILPIPLETRNYFISRKEIWDCELYSKVYIEYYLNNFPTKRTLGIAILWKTLFQTMFLFSTHCCCIFEKLFNYSSVFNSIPKKVSRKR